MLFYVTRIKFLHMRCFFTQLEKKSICPIADFIMKGYIKWADKQRMPLWMSPVKP